MDISKPLIAATLHLESELKFLSSLAEEKIIDAVEFRADRFYNGSGEELGNALRKAGEIKLPVILTFRQGEIENLSEEERLELIFKLLPGADAVDIELRSGITERAAKKAKSLSKTVIISEHDFEKTPAESELDEIFSESMEKGADIVKIAVMPNFPSDAAELMCFCLKHSKKHPLICISMGAIGRFTRFCAPFFGSSITYGFISEPIAPGQVDVRELKRELGKFF
jgi:3-dehydroquinate dehydratase I